MTRKELEIRENAVLSAYRDSNVDVGVGYVLQLISQNQVFEKNILQVANELNIPVQYIEK